MDGRYQLLPPLRPEEYAALREDIQKRGILVPIDVDDEGNILDGHNRQMIADELGLEAPRIVRSNLSDTEKREHVLKMNLIRRHLGPVSWAMLFRQLLDDRGVIKEQGARNDLTSATVAEVAEELGVPERTARWRLAQAEQLAPHPEIAQAVDRGEMPVKKGLTLIAAKREPIAAPSDIDLRLGVAIDAMGDMPDGCAALICTHIAHWDDLDVPMRLLDNNGALVYYKENPLRLVTTLTKPNDLVIDPEMGDGAVALACLQSGRRFIGCTIHHDQFAVAQDRVQYGRRAS